MRLGARRALAARARPRLTRPAGRALTAAAKPLVPRRPARRGPFAVKE
jgi:hypothetical protein